MARAHARAGTAQRLTGYAILAVLGLFAAWVLARQARFNPAVIQALETPPAKSAAASPGTGPMASAALLPEPPGFTAQGGIESYGPETLSDKIDGKAELYLPAGFKEMSCRGLGAPDGSARLDVFLYEMDSPQNAYAVFSAQRRPGAAASSLAANAYATANALFFTHGPFYVEIVADKASDALIAVLEDYGRALVAGLPAGEDAPDLAGLLPKQGLNADSVRLSAADAFGLEGFSAVLTAEYALASGEGTAFLARRDSPEAAKAQADAYVAFLKANGYAPAGEGLHALDTSFEAVFVAGSTVAGVHDASSAEAARELAGMLAQALREAR